MSEELIRVGKILKTYRLKGELNFTFEPFLISDTFNPTYFFIGSENKSIPYFVEAFTVSNSTTGICQLEEVDSKEKAKKLTNQDLFLKAKDVKSSGLKMSKPLISFIESLLGYSVFDNESGLLGKVIDIYEIRDSLIIQVDWESKELLIPLHDDFITELNHDTREIHLDLPNGLLNLY